MVDKPKITMRENGPLVVENPPDLTSPVGPVETSAVAALCRCGQSKNKPFCDGSHNEAGFETATDHTKLRNKAIDYTGQVDGHEVTISFTPLLCAHAAECGARAANVFNPAQKPWIKPENGSLPEILEVMAACPSGALRVTAGGLPARHLTGGDVSISYTQDGPYHVRNIEIDAEFNAVGASPSKYSLCRCGHSKNKPFCDGTHRDVGWKDGS